MPISPRTKKIYNARYREKKKLEKLKAQPINTIKVEDNESIDTVQEIKPIHVPEKSLSKDFETPPPIKTEFTESDTDESIKEETKHVTFEEPEFVETQEPYNENEEAELDAYLDEIAQKILDAELEKEIIEPSDESPAKENFFLTAIKNSLMNTTMQIIQVAIMSGAGLILSKVMQNSKALANTSTKKENNDTATNSNTVEMPSVNFDIPVVNF